jgi:hypothetical protein
LDSRGDAEGADQHRFSIPLEGQAIHLVDDGVIIRALRADCDRSVIGGHGREVEGERWPKTTAWESSHKSGQRDRPRADACGSESGGGAGYPSLAFRALMSLAPLWWDKSFRRWREAGRRNPRFFTDS